MSKNEKQSGSVKWFNDQKGYGFIVPDNGGRDVFVHVSDVEKSGIGALKEGQRISFNVQEKKGKNSACDLSAD